MFYGSVKDNLGGPLPGFTFYGSDQGTGQYSSFGVTDANGNYAVAALAGTWKAGLDDDNPRFTHYVFSGGIPTTTLTYGRALRSDFVLMLATNHITGYLMDNLNNPIAGVRIHAFADLDRTNRYVGFTSTDANGNYTLNVANGNWSVACNCECSSCDYDLTARGYLCLNAQEVTISGSNGVANFIAQSSLRATTTSLPDGVFNSWYSSQLQASGGQPPYSWSLTPGSAPLPPGLDISSDGIISGTITNSGTFYFYVRVTDARSTTADALLVIYIPSPPLQITTLSLPSAQEGLPYTNQLQAFGGQLPYRWSLALGSLSLPPNLNLSASGVISGTPATNGTFYFIVRATDANSAFTNRSLGLTINPKLGFTLLNRTGNQFQLQLTGVTEQNYTVQFSTNLASSNWFWLLTTNPSAASVTILDPNATNSSRFYRVQLGP